MCNLDHKRKAQNLNNFGICWEANLNILAKKSVEMLRVILTYFLVFSQEVCIIPPASENFMLYLVNFAILLILNLTPFPVNFLGEHRLLGRPSRMCPEEFWLLNSFLAIGPSLILLFFIFLPSYWIFFFLLGSSVCGKNNPIIIVTICFLLCFTCSWKDSLLCCDHLYGVVLRNGRSTSTRC